MIVLDFFIVNVAIPSMQRDLHASSGAIEWILAGYGLTFATTMITAGRLGDEHGRRRMFSLGLALFTIGRRACFLINVPIGIVALALTLRLVPESRAQRPSRLDAVGTVLVTLGPTAIVLPLVEGRQHSWPAWTWLSLAAAPVLLGAFAAHQRWLHRRGGAPLLDLSLFRARSFTAGLVTQIAFECGQASFFLVLALYLQRGRGLTALGPALCSRSWPPPIW
jgi:MFS family permease